MRFFLVLTVFFIFQAANADCTLDMENLLKEKKTSINAEIGDQGRLAAVVRYQAQNLLNSPISSSIKNNMSMIENGIFFSKYSSEKKTIDIIFNEYGSIFGYRITEKPQKTIYRCLRIERTFNSVTEKNKGKKNARKK